MTWFEALTGCTEESPCHVRKHLAVDGNQLRSGINGNAWCCGELETPTLAQLRERVRLTSPAEATTTVREIVADVQSLHCDPSNAHAMFQVASQFNLLEMASPHVTPEDGVGIYDGDSTQGPACAIAAGAGTIYRNYFARVDGKVGQSSRNQIDCLADIGDRLGNSEQRLWKMVNGYALPTKNGLERVNQQLDELDESQLDELRGLLRVGLQLGTQVTLGGSSHVVSQAYCSAMPVSYSGHSSGPWAPFATLILEGAYEATVCAAIEHSRRSGSNRLYLTLLGGGVFGNEMSWVTRAIDRAVSIHGDCGLDIAIVSYGRSRPEVQHLAQSLTRHVRDKTSG